MSLFIGNISSMTKLSELEDLFNKYGRCKVSLKTNYGFVDFDSVRDAEDTLNKCNKKNVSGSEIELKWSDRMNKERFSRGRKHYSRKSGSRSRSKSRSRNSRSKRKEDRHRRHRKRSYSNKKKYSRDHSKSITKNDRKKSRRKSRHSEQSDSSKSKSKSRSKSRSRSRSRSRSHS